MVITGARRKDEILEAVQFIQDELADLLENTTSDYTLDFRQ